MDQLILSPHYLTVEAAPKIARLPLVGSKIQRLDIVDRAGRRPLALRHLNVICGRDTRGESGGGGCHGRPFPYAVRSS